MDGNNAFAAPEADFSAVREPPAGRSAQVTSPIVESLNGTRTWVRVMAFFGFFGGGMTLLGGVFMLGLGVFLMATGSTAEGGINLAVGALYTVMSFVYLLPSIFLWRYAGSMDSLVQSRDVRELEAAMEHQRKFWKSIGILMLGSIVLSILMVVVIGVLAGIGALQ
ncbi:hypothetical protein SCOR_35725 [Sulfidibacter corallicola]|uniref:DUF5362 domain-containing protein n=1 Tax=Sulfidibacter corallicola TaxID=2818388 RepID=A0A8A4TIV5_SULCO|nr:hypothetical protein [Sulfidibacter corallicola]QTD49124.1 hypothetical protein J3U87_26360 [Sulfidibacter corallicola]